MTGLSAKIVSSWLTETDERGLQVAFCHWLISHGFRIVHSTSHGAMEMGKDIIAIRSDGALCTYQLKAQRGGQITMSGFRDDIQPQLRDLSENAVVYPGVRPRRPNHAFIVANVDFHEHVQREIDDFNRSGQGGRAPVALIGKSQLLSDFAGMATALLPDDLASSRSVLEILLNDGMGEFPTEKFSAILEKIVDASVTKKTSTAELRRTLASLTMATEVVSGPWCRKSNDWGCFQAYSCCLMACALARELSGSKKVCLELIDFVARVCRDDLRRLTDEVVDGKAYELAAIVEYDQVGLAKITHVLGIACLTAVLDETDPVTAGTQRPASVLALLKRLGHNRYLWGEGASPHALAIALFLERFGSGRMADEFWTWFVRSLVALCGPGASHYYPPWESLGGPQAMGLLGLKADTSRRAIGSYWCKPIINCAVRLNLRSLVKSIWPIAVTIGHEHFVPAKQSDFFRYLCKTGNEATSHRPLPVSWRSLVTEVKACAVGQDLFRLRPELYLIMLMARPHRIDSDLLTALIPRYCNGTWH